MRSHLPSASDFPLVPANTSDPKASYLLGGLALDALSHSGQWQLAAAMERLCGVTALQSPCGQRRTYIKNYDMTLTWTPCLCSCVLFFRTCGSGSENRSVVLASTAIQLLDERKSPIAAGKWVGTRGPLSHSHTLKKLQKKFPTLHFLVFYSPTPPTSFSLLCWKTQRPVV